MRVLLDTNVLVSGLAFHGAERDLLSMIRADDHSLILNDYLITELTVIMRRKFPDKRGLAEAILGLFRIEKVDGGAFSGLRGKVPAVLTRHAAPSTILPGRTWKSRQRLLEGRRGHG